MKIRIKTENQGFSNKVYFLNLQLTWRFVWACLVLTVVSGWLGITDMSIVSVGIPCAFTELGVHTALIVWKAKVENCRKNKDVNTLNRLEGENEI